MINVLFFGQLKETLNCESLSVNQDTVACSTVGDLKKHLVHLNPNWQSAFESSNILVAVNQTMANTNTIILDNSEVAFFPPVTGG